MGEGRKVWGGLASPACGGLRAGGRSGAGCGTKGTQSSIKRLKDRKKLRKPVWGAGGGEGDLISLGELWGATRQFEQADH